MNKKGFSKKFWYLTIVVCMLLIILISIGYFYFFNREEEIVEKTQSGGGVILNYSSDINGLNIVNAIPTTSVVGMNNSIDGQYFDFSVEAALDGADSIEYEISVSKDTVNSTISDEDIRIYLEKEKSGTYTKIFGPEKFTALKKDTKLGTKKGNMVIYKTKKIKGGTDHYRLRIWMADNSVLPTGNYGVLVNIDGIAK